MGPCYSGAMPAALAPEGIETVTHFMTGPRAVPSWAGYKPLFLLGILGLTHFIALKSWLLFNSSTIPVASCQAT